MHRSLAAGLCRLHDPTNAEGLPPFKSHLDGNLVGGAPHAPGFHLQDRLHIVQGSLEQRERILLAAVSDQIECAIEDSLTEAFFPAPHQDVDKLGHQLVVIFGIGQDLPLLGYTPSGHGLVPPLT